MHARSSERIRWLAATIFSVLVLGGCAIAPPAENQNHPPENLAAFSGQLSGANEVPPVASRGGGRIVAVLDRQTMLLRWKMSFSGLESIATAAQLHGPASSGRNAGPIITFKAPPRSPLEGRATLTPEQAAQLLRGEWYLNVHTARHPEGEIRGQLAERR